jgi:hypothetical protein
VKKEYSSYRKESKNTTKRQGSGGVTQTGQVAASVEYSAVTEHTADSSTHRRKETLLISGKNQDNSKRYKITLKPKETTTTPEQIVSTEKTV